MSRKISQLSNIFQCENEDFSKVNNVTSHNKTHKEIKKGEVFSNLSNDIAQNTKNERNLMKNLFHLQKKFPAGDYYLKFMLNTTMFLEI